MIFIDMVDVKPPLPSVQTLLTHIYVLPYPRGRLVVAGTTVSPQMDPSLTVSSTVERGPPGVGIHRFFWSSRESSRPVVPGPKSSPDSDVPLNPGLPGETTNSDTLEFGK